MEQLDDILRAFVNEKNKFGNRSGQIRDEEKMAAVKKLMLESPLNFRVRVTTLTDEELLIALENIIIEWVSTVQITKLKKFDTIAPMYIGKGREG